MKHTNLQKRDDWKMQIDLLLLEVADVNNNEDKTDKSTEVNVSDTTVTTPERQTNDFDTPLQTGKCTVSYHYKGAQPTSFCNSSWG